MRFILISSAMTMLAACQAPSSDGTNAAAQPNESVVVAELQNAQDAVDDEITNDAAADARNEAGNDDDGNGGDDDNTPDRFNCGKTLQVEVAYGTGDGTARLTIAGKTLALLAADGATAGPYTTHDGLVPGKSLTWSVDGTSATLSQAPNTAPKGTPTETVMKCEAMD